MCTFPLCISYCSNKYFIDHPRNCRDGLDTDDLASLLNSWEDASSDPGLRTQVRPDSHEKSVPALSGSTKPHQEPRPPLPPPGPPPLDIEADITVGEELRVLVVFKSRKLEINLSSNELCFHLDIFSFRNK